MTESFRVVALADAMRVGGEYVDQKLFITYEEAVKRGEEMLKFYSAFRIEKVYEA